MNKTELKSFAVSARRELLEKVALRAKIFGIDKNSDLNMEEQFGQVIVNGIGYPIQMKSAFKSLASQLKIIGYEQLLEEVSYTWFNRIIAIRYMEVNDYLPNGVNVLSSKTGRAEPDIITEFETMGLDIDILDLKYTIHQGKTEEAYRKLLIAQCNELNEILPFLFEKINDYTELLLPDFLLDSESIISKLVREVSEINFHNVEEKTDNVEVLGWLYQFYMSEKKEKVGGLKNTSVKKEDLPVVTQLFTPKWIVKYMVQNSLGKLYCEKYPNNNLSIGWEYYLGSSTNPKKLVPEFNSLEEIKIIDPACGSGHILVYAFDLLFEMYEESGYPLREIPTLILENNLFGIDIDKRATQIANFALVMKAVERQPRLLRKHKKNNIKVNILEIVDSNYSISEEAINYFTSNLEERELIKNLQEKFKNGKQFGSLITPLTLSYVEWIHRITSYDLEKADLIEQTFIEELKQKLLPLLKQALLLSDKYHIVITNPPYHNKYNPVLKEFMSEKYNDYKIDLYSAFIYRTTKMIIENGYVGLMTPFTWMFISTHEKLRRHITGEYTITSLVHPEYHSCYDIAHVPICTFVIQNQNEVTFGDFIGLTEFKGDQTIWLKKAINNDVHYRYRFNNKNFNSIPSSPIAYWASEDIREAFEHNTKLYDLYEVKSGIMTGNDQKFLRLWYEVV